MSFVILQQMQLMNQTRQRNCHSKRTGRKDASSSLRQKVEPREQCNEFRLVYSSSDYSDLNSGGIRSMRNRIGPFTISSVGFEIGIFFWETSKKGLLLSLLLLFEAGVMLPLLIPVDVVVAGAVEARR
jgi:hypothetical protein